MSYNYDVYGNFIVNGELTELTQESAPMPSQGHCFMKVAKERPMIEGFANKKSKKKSNGEGTRKTLEKELKSHWR